MYVVPKGFDWMPYLFRQGVLLKEICRSCEKIFPITTYYIFLVDNSEDEGYCKKISEFSLECVHSPFVPGVKKRLAESKECSSEESAG